MKALRKFFALFPVLLSISLVGCKTDPKPSPDPESEISYTVEEAINAVAEVLETEVYDFSDEDGAYFVTGAMYSASNVSEDDLKSIVPLIMPEGFDLVQDWEADEFSDGTPLIACYYVCKDVVLENAIYDDVYGTTEVIVLQIGCYNLLAE